MGFITAAPLLLSVWAAPEALPEELGAVSFSRDFEQAKISAKQSGRPIFLLFTEVPGCSTVRGFARDALRHPVIIETLASDFVAVAIYNNHPGPDKEVLESFREPAWNNPVVRFLSASGDELAPRYAGEYSASALARRMIAALVKADRKVPEPLRVLAEGRAAAPSATLVFGMYCFWSGEATIGGLDGVRRTRAGFLDGREVVEVEVDVEKTSLPAFLSEVKRRRGADSVYVRDEALRAAATKIFGDRVYDQSAAVRVSDKDTKYYLRQARVSFESMTEAEASRMNAAIAARSAGR